MPGRGPEGGVVQLAGELDTDRLEELGGPVLATGRADRVEPELLHRAGATATDSRLAGGYTLGRPTSEDLPREERVHLPERVAVTANVGTWIGYEAGGSPVLTGHGPFFYWQPPDLADPTDALVPHSPIGPVSPYVEAARAMRAGTTQGGGPGAFPGGGPVTVSCLSQGGTGAR